METRHFLDGRRVLLDALKYSFNAADTRLEFVDNQGIKGQIFTGSGAFDWATCDQQGLDIRTCLADFLQIRPAEIAQLLKRNAGLAGISALADLVQRHGLEPHSVLRQCIDSHVSSALSAIAEMGSCESQIAPYEKGASPLPPNQAWRVLVGARLLKAAAATEPAPLEETGRTERIATQAFGLPGVIGVLVFDSHGRLRAVRSAAATEAKLHALLFDAIELDCIGEGHPLGALDCLVVEHQQAIVVRQRLQGIHGLTVLLILERTGRLGAVKHRLERLEVEPDPPSGSGHDVGTS